MNREHLQLCTSAEWAALVRDELLPWVLGDSALGDDVLEIVAGPGLITDLLLQLAPRMTAVEIDDGLADSCGSGCPGGRSRLSPLTLRSCRCLRVGSPPPRASRCCITSPIPTARTARWPSLARVLRPGGCCWAPTGRTPQPGGGCQPGGG